MPVVRNEAVFPKCGDQLSPEVWDHLSFYSIQRGAELAQHSMVPMTLCANTGHRLHYRPHLQQDDDPNMTYDVAIFCKVNIKLANTCSWRLLVCSQLPRPKIIAQKLY